jgi:two-component system chemotaxis response regulator CheB
MAGKTIGLGLCQSLMDEPHMGVAIVIVNHLRNVATRLHEILPHFTEMPVELITESLLIEPNHVFIIPEKRDLHVFEGAFRLKPISKPRGWPDVITVFLRSLTNNWNGKLIAVIVSGYDGDGSAALCGIKEVGGITIAQKLDTAKQPDMPESAIESGCIDFVLSPEDIEKKGEIYENKHGVVDRSSQGCDCGSFGQGGGNKRYRIKCRKAARTV